MYDFVMTTALLKRNARPVPGELRSNFLHLYLDIAWYGLLSGSAISFVAIYATRLGAGGFEIGLISAGPAIVNLLLTLPAGRWLEGKRTERAVFWGAILHRLFYIPWVFLPILLAPQLQVWALIGLILLMSAPGTMLAVGFNAMFAEAVPPDWRSHVAGSRNALLAITFTASTLVSGYILNQAPFPTGYQIVFAIGVVGAAMSSLHLLFVRPTNRNHSLQPNQQTFDLVSPGRVRSPVAGLRTSVGLRFLARSGGRDLLNVSVLRGPFGRVVGVLFAFHLAQFMSVPLFPLVMVNQLGLSDAEISLGTALFYVAVLLGSMQLDWISQRLGHHRVTALGAIGLASYPAFLAISRGLDLYLAASVAGGLAWSLIGGSLANYVLERTPEDDRPAHLAWYNLALNAGILLGSLAGPLLGDAFGLSLALALVAAARLAAGLLVWRCG